jgi:glutaminyl-peptide cyclotransferase
MLCNYNLHMFTHKTLARVLVVVPTFVIACGGDKQAPAAAAAGAARPAVPTGTPTFLVQVVHRYPHDATAFTEGFEWDDGVLYEGTGIVGQSGVRRTDLTTGAMLKYVELPPPHFGEGVTVFHGTLYELTWKEGIGFKYDAKTFAPRGRFTYTGEGWGLTHDARSLIMSDGTSVLRFLDPATLRVQRTLAVTADGMSVPRLNELERIHGELWANLWQSSNIARIDPATGKVIAWVDLSPLTSQIAAGDTIDVANGIAYDSATDRIFVTGKLWPSVYEIRVGPRE